ncbi:MAG: Glu-tRNA(Gln) amidotransferase subunit GatE [Candidatus Nanoarchaeia archaeon]
MQAGKNETVKTETKTLNYELNYAELGLKAGVEIHQQLATQKLFCCCPSQIRRDAPHFKIKRELRPLAGELGKIDPAAIFERKKRKYYIYEGYFDTNCLVELDEEPPHEINPEALKIALIVAKMLHCKFPDVLQVMRKTIVDGSNTSGFQRTVLIGTNGYLETSFGKVGIQSVALEEDAARRIAEDSESVTFRLDRLGIPLIEISTTPDCHTPEQVREVAEKLGILLRATGKVARGLGTIRQDLNISISGHPRVELKGVQELPHMPKIIELEVKRQLDAIKSGQKLEPHVRNILPDLSSKFLRPMPGAARMYPETDLPLIFLDKKEIEKLELPKTPEQLKSELVSLGLSKDLVEQFVNSPYLNMFFEFVQKFNNLNPNLIATTILIMPKEIRRKLQLPSFELRKDELELLFKALSGGNKEIPAIVKESLPNVIEDFAKTKPKSFNEACAILAKYKILSESELKKEISKLKKEFKGPKEKLFGFIMGQLRGKADPKKLAELIKE